MKADAEMLVSSLGRRASELFKQFMASAPFDGAAFNYDPATAFGILQGYQAELSKLVEAKEQLAPILDFLGIESLNTRDLTQLELDLTKLWDVWVLKVGFENFSKMVDHSYPVMCRFNFSINPRYFLLTLQLAVTLSA